MARNLRGPVACVRLVVLTFLLSSLLLLLGGADAAAADGVTLQLAQSHVIPCDNDTGNCARTWTGAGLKEEYATLNLHLVGLRKTLAIVDFNGADVEGKKPKITVANDDVTVPVEIPLAPPALLPETYGDVNDVDRMDGEPFSTTAYSAKIPARYIARGLAITVVYDGQTMPAPAWNKLVVGSPTHFEIVSMPFYFFGADPITTADGEKTLTPDFAGKMPESVKDEYTSRLPIASFKNTMHPAGFFKSEYVVIGPRQGGAAYRVYHKEDIKDGFAMISAAMNIIGSFREVDGSNQVAKQYYGSIVSVDKEGRYTGPGGGLGGGHIGTGDYTFGGIFFHEQGHAFGLPHAGGAYDSKAYPYEGGGLEGSGWGYDEYVDKFIDPYDKKCDALSAQSREDEAPHRCYKQDPMQSGHGDRDDGLYYSISSDFQNARIQRYFEGTDLNGGRLFRGVTPAGGYARWNPATQRFADVGEDGYRTTENVKVIDADLTAAIFTMSCPELKCDGAGTLDTSTLEATQIYPPVSYRGNAKEYVDVDDPKQLGRFHYPKARADGRDEKFYCDVGCDFIAAFTFPDGTRKRIMLSGSFRKWLDPSGPVYHKAPLPNDSDSYKTKVVAALGSNPTRVDLMYAPFAWEGVHARKPQLITSWTKSGGEMKPTYIAPEVSP